MTETRFIPTSEGGRIEMLIPINGVPTWRAARWETEVCVGYPRGLVAGTHGTLRPVLEEGEELRGTVDGRMEIVRVRP